MSNPFWTEEKPRYELGVDDRTYPCGTIEDIRDTILDEQDVWEMNDSVECYLLDNLELDTIWSGTLAEARKLCEKEE